MAARMNDEATVKEAQSWSKRGRASFEKKLWNKNYFMAYNNVQEGLTEKQLAHHAKTAKVSVACVAGQLVGVWAARCLGLGDIVSGDKVKQALSTILASNAMASPFGAVNAVLPTGEKDRSNLQSENCWLGLTYVVAGLAIQGGRVPEGLALAKKAWESVHVHTLNPWNQPDLYSSTDASPVFGDHYLRNMVIWSLVLDLAKTDKSLESFLSVHKR
jgi:uncharacterized protein (DUF608 family)